VKKAGTPNKGSKKLSKTNWDRPSQKPAQTQAQTQAPANGKKVAPKRDWTRPVDHHAEKHAGESHKMHERHVNKFSKFPPKKSETQAQKRERKQKEEELTLLAREEEKERQQIAMRKAKQKAKEQQEVESQMKDVYIPEIINVANLSRILGIRLGKFKSINIRNESG
jgi:translation initiation factor IF-2